MSKDIKRIRKLSGDNQIIVYSRYVVLWISGTLVKSGNVLHGISIPKGSGFNGNLYFLLFFSEKTKQKHYLL